MSGGSLTDQQIRIYMNERKSGKTQCQAAAKANLSERSGRRIDKGEIALGQKKGRQWRTRTDPLDRLWKSVVCPLLEETPSLTPITVHEHLSDNYPDDYQASSLRTLQRRIKQWQIKYGPEKEVIFRQQKIPGDMGISDFTRLKDIVITIKQQVFDHQLYHYRLVFSGWRFVKIIHGGESFAALSAGLQDAFWRSGGIPLQHRTDSLSAAYNNVSEQAVFTKQYASLSHHYGFKPTRNNPGVSHENGAIESPHGHLKQRMRQALLLRGSNDFDSLEEYQSFLDKIVFKLNRQHKVRFEEERKLLQALPKHRTHDYSEVSVSVTSSSTITVKRVLYSVPSQLIGCRLMIHVHDDRLILFAGHEKVGELTRLYSNGTIRNRNINYRHVIHSLVKKPQAFRHSQLRDDLLPNADYQRIWQHVDEHLASRLACKYIVSLLYLASSDDCESALGRYVCQGIDTGKLPGLDNCRQHFSHSPKQSPIILVQQHDLNAYDACITSSSPEENHA